MTVVVVVVVVVRRVFQIAIVSFFGFGVVVVAVVVTVVVGVIIGVIIVFQLRIS